MATRYFLRPVRPGDFDVMSQLAAKNKLTLCGHEGKCTRAAGHNEGDSPKASDLHVQTDDDFHVIEVWR